MVWIKQPEYKHFGVNMKRYLNSTVFFVFILFITSCSSLQTNLDSKYQPLGMVVMTANGLLMAKYPQTIPENVSQEEYKTLLKNGYLPLYEKLLPFGVDIKKGNKSFIVSVFDGTALILTDWSCTETRIDCWNYNNKCNPDTLKVICDK